MGLYMTFLPHACWSWNDRDGMELAQLDADSSRRITQAKHSTQSLATEVYMSANTCEMR